MTARFDDFLLSINNIYKFIFIVKHFIYNAL